VAWMRLEVNVLKHPKFLALSAGAVLLWLEGKSYCEDQLTDGLIPRSALKTFRFKARGRVDELCRPCGEGPDGGMYAALWEVHPMGFKMHDYLDWNRCRDEVLAQQAGNRKRQQDKREMSQGIHAPDVTGHRSQGVTGLEKKREEKSRSSSSSRRPIFTGARMVLFQWQHDELSKSLGKHADAFDVDGWIRKVDAGADASGQVVPVGSHEQWRWIQAQFRQEVTVRQLHEQARDAWVCPHVVKCARESQCLQAKQLGREEVAS
jgi:hypothetical protein